MWRFAALGLSDGTLLQLLASCFNGLNLILTACTWGVFVRDRTGGQSTVSCSYMARDDVTQHGTLPIMGHNTRRPVHINRPVALVK